MNKSGESGHCCLIPYLRGNACRFSPLSMMLDIGLSHMTFIMLRYISSLSIFWRVFIIILSSFLHLLMWSHGFYLICWCGVSHYFVNIEKSCIFAINPTWSWSNMVLLMYFCIQIAVFCWGFLCLCSSVVLAYNFLFFFCVCVFVWFWYQGDGSLIKWIWQFSVFCNFLGTVSEE